VDGTTSDRSCSQEVVLSEKRWTVFAQVVLREEAEEEGHEDGGVDAA
jgi:hypothetical protein